MEFLMSYGWALLVVLLVIAALAYFGMLNPERFLPDKVNLGSGLTVMSSTLDERFLTLIVNNGLGKALYNFAINATLCGTDGVTSGTYTLAEGESKKIIIPCGKQLKNSKFKSDLITTYSTMTYSESISHQAKGDLRMTVNDGCRTSDMVAGWNFEGNNMKSCSGIASTCTGSACPTKTSGKIGDGYEFDGVDDCISTVNGINVVGSVTFSAWVKPKVFDSNLRQIIACGDTTGGQDPFYSRFLNSNTLDYDIYSEYFPSSPGSAISDSITFTSYISLNTWSLVTIVYENAQTMKIYVNDQLIKTTPATTFDNKGSRLMPLYIGCIHGVQLFSGTIDEVYVVNRALSAEEVKAIYLSQK
jgi:hypothetical protein